MDWLLKFLANNKDSLPILLTGIAFLFSVLGFASKYGWEWLKRRRKSQLTSPNFPFQVIKPRSPVVVRQLMSNHAEIANRYDPLDDFNIPYQARQVNRSVRLELQQLLEQHQWVLVLGWTGIGKTREAAEVAKILNSEGWTVLKFTGDQWLEKPPKFPSEHLSNQDKLLFFLDDLNYWMTRQEESPNADDPLQPLRVPFQVRLQETLEFYKTECRAPQNIRVLATARNETTPHLEKPDDLTEWDKLAIEKYPKLWRGFHHYELPEPQDQVIVELLQDTSNVGKVSIKSDDSLSIAKCNDGTFRNIVENLRTARANGHFLTQENFIPTLSGTWTARYQRVKARYPFTAPVLYDAVALLRALGISLEPFAVVDTARMISHCRWWHPRWWRISHTLNKLKVRERLLEPRDGQIEAKSNLLEPAKYAIRLWPLLEKWVNRQPEVMEKSLWRFSILTATQKCFQASLLSFNALLKFKPNDPTIWLFRGDVLWALGRKEDAIVSYQTVLKYEPDSPIAWNDRGLVLRRLNRPEEALASLNRALGLQPNTVEFLFNRGSVLGQLNRPDEALESFDKALELEPDFAEAWCYRGNALSDLNHKEEALLSYEKAFELTPDFAEAWQRHGVVLDELGQFEEALKSFNIVLKLNVNDFIAQANKGVSLVKLRRFKEALNSFDIVLKLNPNDSNTWCNRGSVLSELRQFKEALNSFDKALRLNPDNPNAWYNRGLSLMKVGEIEAALKSFNKASDTNPNNFKIWLHQGLILNDMNCYEESLKCFDKAIENLNPDVSEDFDVWTVWSVKGVTFCVLGRYKDALHSFHEALKLKPDYQPLWMQRGKVLGMLGHSDYALDSFNVAVNLQPNDPNAWLNRGMALSILKRNEEALRDVNKALEFESESLYDWIPQAWLIKGISLLELGQYDQALDSFEENLKLSSGQPGAWYGKARCHAHKQQANEAIAALQSAMQIDPSYIEGARTDSDFDPVRDNPDFRALITG